ncbi:MAG: PAS domain S-box protein, partial [Anaerolineaceae bacterium]|nr:PAS domain S-box protein [Anaerolineaceae bacterium]
MNSVAKIPILSSMHGPSVRKPRFKFLHTLWYKTNVLQKSILNGLDDGVIVISLQGQIIYLNKAAENLVGISSKDALGIPIEQIMINWTSLLPNIKSKFFEYKGSVNFNGTWRYFNIRLTTVQNKRGKEIAKTIVLRDTTERKSQIEVRKTARDEMFVFLRSFFNSDSGSINQDQFFPNALYQIAYTFNIQLGALLLVDSSPAKKIKYSLAAKIGAALNNKEMVAKLHETLNLISWFDENHQPQVIDSKQMPGLLGFTQDTDHVSVALLPLVFADQLFGLLVLARTIPAGFSGEDVNRLTVVSQELASFLDAENNRRIEIAHAERKRLIKDLHDSITQKLYGMVVLTESVQIGMESGMLTDIRNQMALISESARQALREMRLFLYELEPVDIESEGLVSVLQQRVASVENRSGLRARVICDEDISLSREKERNLYYIAQEALNNILKHAQAKSVVLKLKKRKGSISLQIIDDGAGFDLKNVETGGLGIKNMRARAMDIGAK